MDKNRQQFEQELEKLLPQDQIRKEEPMSRHTTFRVGGAAEYFVTPSIEQVPDVVALCRRFEQPLTVIGNGSNLLVSDAGLRGVVLEFGKAASGIRLLDGEDLAVKAGTLLSETAAFAAKNGLSGMEFAAGIPGSVGGAVVMNAGAYGGEMKDILSGVRVLTRKGEIKVRPADELDLSYRHSRMMDEEELVLEARLNLTQGSEAVIRAKMEELRKKRIEKQPLEYPSAGSTFKRPEGYFAGKLIEDAGLRGFRIGDAQVSEKHCGFVINRGAASAAQIMELMQHVQERVKEFSGVDLEPEVRLLGF
ncbi:MAG: UDP-N-acetylmuramate dehydrogenase [Eubacterium sp.]|nr:UDP-N-acetylmuramate dehydrogenase [Eubacterium sp.]